jgi:hypothetical protein
MCNNGRASMEIIIWKMTKNYFTIPTNKWAENVPSWRKELEIPLISASRLIPILRLTGLTAGWQTDSPICQPNCSGLSTHRNTAKSILGSPPSLPRLSGLWCVYQVMIYYFHCIKVPRRICSVNIRSLFEQCRIRTGWQRKEKFVTPRWCNNHKGIVQQVGAKMRDKYIEGN